jgi:hypothetical protein
MKIRKESEKIRKRRKIRREKDGYKEEWERK